jgi:hypothetical protein
MTISVQSVFYNADGFLVQLTDSTVETTTFPFNSSISTPIPSDGVLYDDTNKELVVPPGISSFSFIIDGEAALLGTSVDITVGDVSITQVLSNNPSDTNTSPVENFGIYYESMAKSLESISESLVLIEFHQRRLRELAETTGVRMQNEYDALSQVAIYRLLVEQGSSKVLPSLTIISINDNTCKSNVDHLLSVGDEVTPLSSTNGLNKELTYIVSEIVSSTEFKLENTNLINSPNILINSKVNRKDTSSVSDYINKVKLLSGF